MLNRKSPVPFSTGDFCIWIKDLLFERPATVTEEPLYVGLFQARLFLEYLRKIVVILHKCLSEFSCLFRCIHDRFVDIAHHGEVIDRVSSCAEFESLYASCHAA